jgi:hypothetical protein
MKRTFLFLASAVAFAFFFSAPAKAQNNGINKENKQTGVTGNQADGYNTKKGAKKRSQGTSGKSAKATATHKKHAKKSTNGNINIDKPGGPADRKENSNNK